MRLIGYQTVCSAPAKFYQAFVAGTLDDAPVMRGNGG
jgi:hypothetical protein